MTTVVGGGLRSTAPVSSQVVTPEYLLARFAAEYIEAHGLSAARRYDSVLILGKFDVSFPGTLLDAQPEDLMRFVGQLQRAKMHPNTVAKYLGVIRPFYGWAEQVGLIDWQQAARMRGVKDPRGASPSVPRPYKPTEIRQLYASLAAKYPLAPAKGKGSRALVNYFKFGRPPKGVVICHSRRLQVEAQVSLALEIGMRRLEIFRSTIDMIHPDNDFVVVPGAKGRNGLIKVREVPYTTHAREAVRDWLNFRAAMPTSHKGPWLNLSPRGARFEDGQGFRGFQEALSAIGGGYEWHRLRHTAATTWLKTGKVPLEQIQYILGHANIQQTLAYAEIVGEDVATSMAAGEDIFAKYLGLAAA